MSWQKQIKEKKLEISIVHFSELAGRIDAEYYKPMFLKGEALLENKESAKLSDIADVKGGKRLPKGETFSEAGIPYIRAEDVKNNFVNYESSPKISIELHNKLKAYQTKYDDVLITIAGSVGFVGLVKFVLKNCNLTENCAKVINLKSINPDYLFSFLLSKYGQNQIEREKVGTSQPKLALARIRDFRIPIPKEDLQVAVKNTLVKAKEFQDSSQQQYRAAEQLLLRAVNLEGYQISDESISVRNFSRCLEDDRSDAEYWQPKYDQIVARMPATTMYKLGDLADVETGQYIKEYVNAGADSKPFIRGTDISQLEIDEDGLYFVNPNDQKPKHLARKNDVVVARVGSIGLCARIQDHLVGSTISDNLIAIRAKKGIVLNSFYLATYLNSFVGQELMEKFSRGSVQQRLNQETLKDLPIPLIEEKMQTRIAEKIIMAHSMKNRAKYLVEQAKNAVDLFLETDESVAEKLLTD